MVEIFKVGLVIACLFIVVDLSWKIISENKIHIAQLEKSRYVCLLRNFLLVITRAGQAPGRQS